MNFTFSIRIILTVESSVWYVELTVPCISLVFIVLVTLEESSVTKALIGVLSWHIRLFNNFKVLIKLAFFAGSLQSLVL